MMNIAIIGATGNFGRLFSAKLLANPNYHLTVISKSAGNIFEDSFRVTAKTLDATNQKDLKNALEGADIVYISFTVQFQALTRRPLPAIWWR